MRVLIAEDVPSLADDIAEGLRYLAKPFHFPELVLRIRALARRQPASQPRILRAPDIELDPQRHAATRNGHPLDLSVKEFCVLEALLRAAPAFLGAENLLEQVWDERADPVTNAVFITISRATPQTRRTPRHPNPAQCRLPHHRPTIVKVTVMKVTLKLGDISRERADAIVNAANSSLLGGGGVDGAIHRRGGPAILTECLELRKTRYSEGLPAGQAVATTAGDLDARWVIHTVGPVYSAREDRSAVLVSCYEQSLRVADELGARTVAFPAVSAGVYGWPAESAARIALTTVSRAPAQLEEARFVLFTEDMLSTFRTALGSLGPG